MAISRRRILAGKGWVQDGYDPAGKGMGEKLRLAGRKKTWDSVWLGGYMNSDPKKSSNGLPKTESDELLLPTPFAIAGIGLLLGAVLPGGITGGQGFLLGLVIGILLSVIMPALAGGDEVSSTRCPTCGQVVTEGVPTKATNATDLGGSRNG